MLNCASVELCGKCSKWDSAAAGVGSVLCVWSEKKGMVKLVFSAVVPVGSGTGSTTFTTHTVFKIKKYSIIFNTVLMSMNLLQL